MRQMGKILHPYIVMPFWPSFSVGQKGFFPSTSLYFILFYYLFKYYSNLSLQYFPLLNKISVIEIHHFRKKKCDTSVSSITTLPVPSSWGNADRRAVQALCAAFWILRHHQGTNMKEEKESRLGAPLTSRTNGIHACFKTENCRFLISRSDPKQTERKSNYKEKEKTRQKLCRCQCNLCQIH